MHDPGLNPFAIKNNIGTISETNKVGGLDSSSVLILVHNFNCHIILSRN